MHEVGWPESDEPVIAQEAVERMRKTVPDLMDRYAEVGQQRCLEDTAYHLQFLRTALEMQEPSIFSDYRSWLRGLLEPRGVPLDDITANFMALAEVLGARYGERADDAVALLRSSWTA